MVNAVWINDPISVARANYKPEQLKRSARFGLRCPDSLITNMPALARDFCMRHSWRVVTKPIGHGDIYGAEEESDQIVYTNLLGEHARTALAQVAHCPTFFQRHVEKSADIRVTVVADAVHAVRLFSQENTVSTIDCRRENMQLMRYERCELPIVVASALIALVASYGLIFGAIDLVEDPAGDLWFLELNPAGQWAWLEQLGHGSISSSLINALAAS